MTISLAQAPPPPGSSLPAGQHPDALASRIAEIRARAEAGFDAATYLELKGTRSTSRLTVWEEVLLAALAARIGLDEDVDPADLDTVRRLGLA